MPATLYHVPRTISSPIVQILLELDLVNNPIIVEEIDFRALKSPEQLAINPMGTSPAFEDTDLDITMWESGAVLAYLLERYDVENIFYPPPTDANAAPAEIKTRAKYLQLKQYIIATVYPFIASIYLHSLKDPDQQDAEYMAAANYKCTEIFGPVLTKWLGDGPYFLGDHISAVDFLAAKPLRNFQALGWLNQFPALEDLLERVSSRPTYTEAYDALGAKSFVRDQSIVLVPNNNKSIVTKKRFSFAFRRTLGGTPVQS